MNKAIFLDRDGVINKERGEYTYRIQDFIINDGLVDFLKVAISKDFLIIIISNQGGIAKGLYNQEDVEKLHTHFVDQMTNENIFISDIFYCPHHQDYGRCLCRKPGSLLVEKAIATYDIDITNSIMIGDKDRDVEAAVNSGIKGIKVDSNENLINYLDLLN
jgi:D-glycero-D-manno-heptose 1,7-bisphosphate phosphatase